MFFIFVAWRRSDGGPEFVSSYWFSILVMRLPRDTMRFILCICNKLFLYCRFSPEWDGTAVISIDGLHETETDACTDANHSTKSLWCLFHLAVCLYFIFRGKGCVTVQSRWKGGKNTSGYWLFLFLHRLNKILIVFKHKLFFFFLFCVDPLLKSVMFYINWN